jgi:hypothetical protein
LAVPAGKAKMSFVSLGVDSVAKECFILSTIFLVLPTVAFKATLFLTVTVLSNTVVY